MVAESVLLLALTVWQEARGESIPAQIAVAEAVLNRKESACFPKSIEGVISQRGQFSWYPKRKKIGYIKQHHGASWKTALQVANNSYINHYKEQPKSIGKRQYFYSGKRPYWAKGKSVKKINNLNFIYLECKHGNN